MTYIKFGHCFNQYLEKGVLPNNLQHLEFGHNYDQVIAKDVLPNSIVFLEIGKMFNQDTSNIPSSLQLIHPTSRIYYTA